MIGDRSIALLAFLAAALLHLVVFVLASYVPIAKLEQPTPPSRTRYVVQFQQPAPTTTPTTVPIPRTPPPVTPMLPVQVQPRPKQPVQTPQPVRIIQQQAPPTAVEVQRPEPVVKPIEMQAQPRQPAQPQKPVRVRPRRELPKVANAPRPKPVDPVKRPKRITARKPADIKVRQTPKPRPVRVKRPKRPASPKPSAPSQPIAPRQPVAPRVPTPRQAAAPAKPALRPAPPSAPPVQDLQRQYLAMVSKALQRHKRYPRTARRRGLSGKVVLDFVILPNGQVTEARIVAGQSTRHGILNKAALRALKRASPLPPFPKTLRKPSLRVTLPILYELTER